MRRKIVIALLGLGVIAGFGGEIARIRYLHRGGSAPFSRFCHRDHCCKGGHSDAAKATNPSANPGVAAGAAEAAPPAK